MEELSSTNTAKKEVERKEGNTKRLEQKMKNSAWSEKETAKEERDRRSAKKARKRAWLKNNARKSAQSEQASVEDQEKEWEELAKEERLAKKRKKGLVSEEDHGFTDL